jgi:hypothetical protein
LPTATPLIIEATRIVAVTPVPTVTPVSEQNAAPSEVAQATPTAEAPAAKAAQAPPAETAQAAPVQAACPTASTAEYRLIPMEGADLNHPDSGHGDLNLALRGYVATGAGAELIDLAGGTDSDAPKLSSIFAGGRTPQITGAYQTYDWKWDCGKHGCRGDLITDPEVTLLGLATTAGEAIRLPSKRAEIFGGGFVATVLYAEPTRITVAYTRDGTVAHGYAVQIEGICVDPNLLAAYRQGNGAARSSLPGLHSGDTLGTAAGTEIVVGIRDRGRFMDPRSRKDWW